MGNSNEKRALYSANDFSNGNKRQSLNPRSKKNKRKSPVDRKSQKRESLHEQRLKAQTQQSSSSFGTNPMPKRSPTQSSRPKSANRYEGLSDPLILTISRSSNRNSARSSTQSSVLNLVTQQGQIELVDPVNVSNRQMDEDDPPPPPPPPGEEDILTPSSMALAPEQELVLEDFVDYTVVPLLLRAKLSYAVANGFGDAMKTRYSPERVQQMMSNPFDFFAILAKEGVHLTDEEKFSIVEDRYWTEAAPGTPSDSRTKRTSFVYYQESPKAQPRQSQRRRESYKERASQRNEFDQERSNGFDNREQTQEGPSINMREVRKSLEYLGKAGFFDDLE